MIIYLAIAFLAGLAVGLVVGKSGGVNPAKVKKRPVEKVPDETDIYEDTRPVQV